MKEEVRELARSLNLSEMWVKNWFNCKRRIKSQDSELCIGEEYSVI